MLKEYEDQQKALQAARDSEERRRAELEAQQQAEFEQRQREQAERERMAQEQLMQQQMMQYNNQAAQQASELEREMLAMRGQFERDQLLLEQYDRVSKLFSSCFVVFIYFWHSASKLWKENLMVLQPTSMPKWVQRMN